MKREPIVYGAQAGHMADSADADPVLTEVVRHGLNSVAEQMKRALVRSAFSPVIYEVFDFAVAIYDPRIRLLSQAPTLPHFMGTLGFCIEHSVAAVGGEEALEPGDVLLYNIPYGSGSHPQDAALVMPVFLGEGNLIGYTVVKAHWLDIGGKEPYSTNTVDVFQEGTLFPGLKLYRRGELVDDVFRMVTANSRVPQMVGGDIQAEAGALRVGAAGLRRLVERFGEDAFWVSVERMFDHGEAVARSYLEQIPDGRYTARGELDDNGIDDEPVPFEVAVEIRGSDVRVDFSNAPDAQAGPINCPLPETVSGSRLAITLLAGHGEAPNEGQFRPLEVVARPGSMFHPEPPSPCFLYAWPIVQAVEAIYEAISQALPAGVPARSGSDQCALVWWGKRAATGEPWADGAAHPIGLGGHVDGDGASHAMHHVAAWSRVSPVEIWEARNPWLMEKVELAPDSCGPGRHRGGLGADMHFQLLEDGYVTTTLDHTRSQSGGVQGGSGGRPNRLVLRSPDGSTTQLGKATAVKIAKGSTVELACGGGSGYGPPSERDPEQVRADLREGYITEEHARRFYPHALEVEVEVESSL